MPMASPAQTVHRWVTPLCPAAFAAAAAPDHGPHPVRQRGGWRVECVRTRRSQPVLPPRTPPPARVGAVALPGADTDRVLRWLARRDAGPRRC